jgi:effector-binding domain-containing protein
MLDQPRIVESRTQLTALVHVEVPRSRIREVMGPALAEVRAALDAQGIAAAGPWFTHHLSMDPDRFDLEICVPVARPVAAVGRVQAGQLPARTVARALYRGGYEGLAAAWAEVMAWMQANGHTPAADLWERYVAGPESGSDPAGWQTELNRPLAG